MDPNTISATLSTEDQQAIHAAIDTLRQKLPFLIDLNIQDRRVMPKLGDKTVGFVQKAVQIANSTRRCSRRLSWTRCTRTRSCSTSSCRSASLREDPREENR